LRARLSRFPLRQGGMADATAPARGLVRGIRQAQIDATDGAARRLMDSADAVIAALELAPHPEGGWYRETYRSDAAPGTRAATTAIYYLLRRDERSHWHRVDASEIWHWYGGAALELRIGHDTVRLGGDLVAGERPQAVVPAFEFAGFELAPAGWEPGN